MKLEEAGVSCQLLTNVLIQMCLSPMSGARETALPSVGISQCIENDPSLGSLCEPVSCLRSLLEGQSDKRQVHLKAAAEGVADPGGDTECCVHLHSESRRQWIHHSRQGVE